MNQLIIVSLFCCLLHIESVSGLQPLGLRAAAYLRGLLFGAEANTGSLRGNIDYGHYNTKITENYLLIVSENEMKQQHIWLGENIYDFTDPDFLLGANPNETGWVQQNSMQIRGHNLGWGSDDYVPIWLLKQEATITSDQVRQLLSDYIHTVVSRYRGKIPWWDVINEAIDDRTNTNPFNLRDCFWFRKLGPDYLKYAFTFAHEADPDTKLYYNDYHIENIGFKATSTMNLVNWLRSEGVIVDGIGLQWHIDISTTVTPGDGHYQIAQQFIDNKFDIMVTELDVAVPINGSYPSNFQDLQTQGNIYRSVLEYVLHFSPNCKAMLTWGFTDRHTWMPYSSNDTRGVPLPLDYLYLPKPAYRQMLEVMSHVLNDGVYRLSPQSEREKCLGISQNSTSNDVQLYNDSCNNAYQKWNITWLGDGTYRLSSLADNTRVLGSYNTTASVGDVQIYSWSYVVDQEWAFSSQGNNTFRIVPRTAWWRVMTVYGTSDNIGIVDLSSTSSQNWILTQ
jgi:endo-1,4-beta-xylanase